MTRGLRPAQKREIADSFLLWLNKNSINSWTDTYLVLREASGVLNQEVFNLWKAFDLLIILGRIERVSPNGKKGCRVVNFAPLTKPVPSDALICNRDNCPILKYIGEVLK